MTLPRDHALAFEGKKHAYRQTQDGVVISFVVHPNDVDATLAAAALGTRYQVALVQLGDEGQPIGGPSSKGRAWEEIPHAEQAGIRCNDPKFQEWVAKQTTKSPADFVREQCGVKSRSELNTGTPSIKWSDLDFRFRKETTPRP